ncbi:MAG: YdeI/OmpD-associated family protein [Ginsengibacter sp.]
MPTGDLKLFYARNRKAWRQWLQKNHAKETGVWLVYYKKNSGKSRVPYDDAVEEALCFGWIDSIMHPIDEVKYKQKFTPRKLKSVWSALNKKRILKLMELDLMAPAGLEIIDKGKLNGSWTQIDHVENLEIPPDLAKIFLKNKKLAGYYKSLARSRQKQWLYRLGNAKLSETRAKRIAEFVTELNLSKKNKI